MHAKSPSHLTPTLPYLFICVGIQIQPLGPFVLCGCTLNKTRYCDVYLFNKLAQTQVVINCQDTVAPSVHQ